MMYFIHSDEIASSNIATALKDTLGLEEQGQFKGMGCSARNDIKLLGIKGRLVEAEYLDGMIEGPMIFLSRHSSSAGIAAFTVHPLGNWSIDNSIGGRPKELSRSSPIGMLKMLDAINAINKSGIELTYEATHHGPYTDRPSFFVELGGNEGVIGSTEYARLIAQAVAESLDREVHYDKIAVGIGGMHYCSKFTRLALEGKYAFSHIMPKYQVSNTDMIGKAFDRSDLKAELAVIEWKGLKAAQREIILRELNLLGIDYAKV